MVFITFSDTLIKEPRKGTVTLRLNTNFPPKVGSLEKAATRGNYGEKRAQPGREPKTDNQRLI